MKITASFFKYNNSSKCIKLSKNINLKRNKNKKKIININNFKVKKKNPFNNIHIPNLIEIINLKFVVLFVFLTCITFCFSGKLVNVNTILYFATNIRNSNKKLVDLNLAEAFLLYNKNNYVLNKVDENLILNASNETEKQKVEKKEDKYINKEAIEVIDMLAEENMISSVFWNKKYNVNVTENSKNLQRISINTLRILNYSNNRSINFEQILNNTINLTKKSDKILLYNTHTSESYANSQEYKFSYTGICRTTDARYNMLSVAKQLQENLRMKGFDAIHDTTPHDYGTYTSAYARSRNAAKNNLEKYGGFGIIIDVHRDATADLNFAPKLDLKGHKIAKCMFVVGIGNDITKNPYYEDNLKLALKLQMIADDVYPDLFRPMIIRNSVYNQDLNKYSLLIEIGATGNTLEEVYLSTRCITNLLNIIYKD